MIKIIVSLKKKKLSKQGYFIIKKGNFPLILVLECGVKIWLILNKSVYEILPFFCRCLNGGRCVSTREGNVSCICPQGLTGPRCERKARMPDHKSHVDTEEVNSTVTSIVTSVLSILAAAFILALIIYFYRKKRLGSAFKHRRMAENLVANNIEFSNQMFTPEDDNEENHGSIILPMSESNNFSNPVYDSMYEENHGLLAENPDPDLIVNAADEDPESVDLLTEKHRGNISL